MWDIHLLWLDVFFFGGGGLYKSVFRKLRSWEQDALMEQQLWHSGSDGGWNVVSLATAGSDSYSFTLRLRRWVILGRLSQLLIPPTKNHLDSPCILFKQFIVYYTVPLLLIRELLHRHFVVTGIKSRYSHYFNIQCENFGFFLLQWSWANLI